MKPASRARQFLPSEPPCVEPTYSRLRNPQFLLFLLRFHDLCNWLRLYRYKYRPKCCTAPTNRPKNRAIRLRSKQKRDCCRKRQQTRLNLTEFEFLRRAWSPTGGRIRPPGSHSHRKKLSLRKDAHPSSYSYPFRRFHGPHKPCAYVPLSRPPASKKTRRCRHVLPGFRQGN